MSNPNQPGQEKFEQDFESFLRSEDSSIHVLYRKLPHVEPDAQLDARVRALAQRALGGQAVAAASAQTAARPRRWLPVLSAAACVTLAAGLAWRIAPNVWTSKKETSAAVISPQPSDKLTPTVSSDVPAPGLTPAQSASMADSATSNPTRNAAEAVARAELARAVTSKTVASRPISASTPAAKAATAQRSEFAPAPPPMASPPVSAQAPAASAPTGFASTPSQAAAAAAKLAAPVPEPQPAAEAVTDQTWSESEKMENAASVRKAAAMRAAPTSSQSSMGGIWHGSYPPDIPPTRELRLAVVQDLLGQGRHDDAMKAYADFRKRYPHDTWPADLLDQLNQK